MDTSSRDYAEATPPPADGIFSAIAATLGSVRRIVSDSFRLISLEIRRAGLTLMWMVALGTIAALLIVTAWLGLMSALALWAVSLGASWASALLAISLANLFAAATAIMVCVMMSRNLLFPATRRQLDGAPAGPEAA